MRLFLSISFFFLSLLVAYPQTDAPMTWEDFVLLMADDTDEDGKGPDSELFEELYNIHIHPINLNSTSFEELKQLFFLSEDQIKDILWYLDKHKPLMSTGEFMFIHSLDKQTRSMLQLFCYAGDSKEKDYSFNKLFKYSQNELTLRTDIPFYTKAGYKPVPDSILIKSPNKVYQGNRLFQSLRYNFSSQNHFFAGFQAEKDPGEKYIDHLAGYAMIKNIGIIKTALLGNYRVSFGHGLVVNTGSSFGKAMKLSSMETIDRGITRQSSTSETGYFTGGATTISLGKINVTAYASYKKADGTFNNDSASLSSLKTDGLHRTQLERSKKHNISISDYGSNIHLDLNFIQLSLTAAYTHINTPLAPKCNTQSSYYRMYNPQGKDFFATSLTYSYRNSKIVFSGETAVNSSGAIATLNQLQWKPNSYNTITLIQRRYGAKYSTINARAFSENSSPQNENAIYLGYKSSLSDKFTLNVYVDAMYFPWLKYQVYGSSYGIEALTQFVYTPNNNNSFTLRYKIKSKQKDDNSKNIGTLKYNTNQNIRLQYNFRWSDNWSFKTTINSTLTSFIGEKDFGFSIGEAIRYTNNNKLRLDASVTYFNTESYNSRIYNYESSLLYTFAMSSYYYKGIRATLLGSFPIIENLFITTKLGFTHLFNKESIGTGLELIDNNHREDLQIQIRYKF